MICQNTKPPQLSRGGFVFVGHWSFALSDAHLHAQRSLLLQFGAQ
jgi:hypothetical protein